VASPAAAVAGLRIRVLLILWIVLPILIPVVAAETDPAGQGSGGLALRLKSAESDPRLQFRLDARWEHGQRIFTVSLPWRSGESGIPGRAALSADLARSGWRILLGSIRLHDSASILFGRRHCSSGAPALLRTRFRPERGRASNWQPEYLGGSLHRNLGRLKGGLLAAAGRRDRSHDGQGFVLGMPHDAEHRQRVGAWRDRTLVGWLDAEAAPGLDLLLLGGKRWMPDPATGEILLLAQGSLARPGWRVGFLAARSEHRLLWLQAAWRVHRDLRFRVDAWRGLEGPRGMYARPGLQLGEKAPGLGIAPTIGAGLDGWRVVYHERCWSARQQAYPGRRQTRKLEIRRRFDWGSRNASLGAGDGMELRMAWTAREGRKAGSLRLAWFWAKDCRLSLAWSRASEGYEPTRGLGVALRWPINGRIATGGSTRKLIQLYCDLRRAGSGRVYQVVQPWPGALRLQSGSTGAARTGISFSTRNRSTGNFLGFLVEWRTGAKETELGCYRHTRFRGSLSTLCELRVAMK